MNVVDKSFMNLAWQPHTMAAALEAWWRAENSVTPTFNGFLARRHTILAALPAETSWWRVGPIDLGHLGKVRPIAPFGYADVLSLGREALRQGKAWPVPPAPYWDGILLFGHNRLGPFTIVEGNHRMISAAIHGAEKAFMPADLHVNVALSIEPFIWHRTGT